MIFMEMIESCNVHVMSIVYNRDYSKGDGLYWLSGKRSMFVRNAAMNLLNGWGNVQDATIGIHWLKKSKHLLLAAGIQ